MSLLPPECPKCNTAHWRHEACPTGTELKAKEVPKEVYEFPVTTPESVPNSVLKRPKKAISTSVSTTVSTKKAVSTESEYKRVKAWRLANLEKYNNQMKEYRRKRAK